MYAMLKLYLVHLFVGTNIGTNVYFNTHRFGLYGTPLDPILFDMEPPVVSPAPKSSSSASSTSNAVPPTFPNPPGIPASGFSYDIPDMQGSSQGGSKLSSDPASSPLSGTHFMRGLLEVEPLHFMCCSTSDGTHVERVGSGQFINQYDNNMCLVLYCVNFNKNKNIGDL